MIPTVHTNLNFRTRQKQRRRGRSWLGAWAHNLTETELVVAETKFKHIQPNTKEGKKVDTKMRINYLPGHARLGRA